MVDVDPTNVIDEAFRLNRLNWDERVAVHLAPGGYDLSGLRSGRGRLNAIEEAELPEVAGDLAGRRVIHLQCHFGHDTLTLAQRGADVVGVDFSPAAIRAARNLAHELGLADRARFVECNLHEAPAAVGDGAAFDLAYVTWGAINWLPDIRAWAAVAAGFLKPDGRLYLLEGHPAALVLDDAIREDDGRPGWLVPYFERGPHTFDEPSDYANTEAVLRNSRTVEWLHGLGDIVTAIIEAGLRIRFLREHASVPWRMLGCLAPGEDGMFRWPDRPWLPLSFSVLAERPR